MRLVLARAEATIAPHCGLLHISEANGVTNPAMTHCCTIFRVQLF
jgi:hypothetical protein